jgi:hypothetical protein
MPETIQDLSLASDEKYWEGVELLAAGRRGAGIYLLGYSAEMVLKNACFLTEGARPFDFVAPRLAPIRKWARSLLPRISHENYHSLWFWVHVLRRKRGRLGRKLAAGVDASLVQRVRRVYGIWVVDMRYKPDEALQREAEAVLDDVTWIRDRQSQLVG